MNITSYKIKAPQRASNLAMLLRKHLSSKTLKSIEQYDFDRVVSLDFGDRRLILEFFSHGNMILTDADYKIIFSFRKEKWKDRQIERAVLYEYPKSKALNPFDVNEKSLSKILTEKDVIRSLVKGLKIGGAYAEEICHLAGIDKHKEGVTELELSMLLKAIKALTERKKEVVLQDGELRPFPLVSGGEIQAKFKSMNEAIDEIYRRVEKKESQKLMKLKLRLEKQLLSLEKFKKEINDNQKKAELLKKNYDKVLEVIKAFNEKRELPAKARKEGSKIIIDLS